MFSRSEDETDIRARSLRTQNRRAISRCLGGYFNSGNVFISYSDVGHIGHEVATANKAEDGDAVVLVQDAQRAQHLA